MKLEQFELYEEQTISRALEKIDDNRKGFLIILDKNKKAVGTMTDGDIRRALIRGKKVNEHVDGCYNREFTWIESTAEFSQVIDLFKNDALTFLPVLDQEKRLVNIITRDNLHALLLQDIQPDMKYDFLNVDDSIIDYEIYRRPWGFYKTTILNDRFQSKVISVMPGACLSLQEHKRREEHWIVVKGKGEVQIGDSFVSVCPGSVLFIPKACKHRIRNTDQNDTLIFIEVQLGVYFGEDDIIRFEDRYGRA